MRTIDRAFLEELSAIGSRGAFACAMLDLGEEMDDLVVLTADLADATRMTWFRRKFPEKFYNVGIAEQNLVGLASGLALEGKTVFATTFAAFASMRACEQARTNMGYMRTNVKLVGADGGVVMGTLGNTHYAVEDIAIMRSMPYMTVLSPSDGLSVYKTTLAAAKYPGPVYLRLTERAGNPIVYGEDYEHEIGRAVRLREGSDVGIIATGSMVCRALEAAGLLEAKGISCAVVDMHTIKPLDTASVDALTGTKLLVTTEEHSAIGGLGAAVAEHLAIRSDAPRHLLIGLPDAFGKIGTYDCQMRRYGLDPESLAEKIATTL